jgi:drug/metabolite transporter (DMT)-like permease
MFLTFRSVSFSSPILFSICLVNLEIDNAIATIFFLGPIFTMIFTHVALGEAVSIVEGVAAICSLFGAALVAHPNVSSSSAGSFEAKRADDTWSHTSGITYAMLGALTSASAFTIVRKLHVKIHFLFSVFSVGAVTTIITTIMLRDSLIRFLASLGGRPVSAVLLVLQGLLALAGQCAFSKSLQHCRGVGVIIRNVDVVLAYAIGIAVLGEIPSLLGCIGAVMVLASVVVITIEQAQST